MLQIPADRYTQNNEELIPTGLILPVQGTPLDFQKPTRIGERIEQPKPALNGYDHNFVIGWNKELKMAARLSEPTSGRFIEVLTTQPAVQLYTGNHLKYAGVCLETQHYPDAIHHTHFPSIVVRPDAPLKETTVFRFGAE